MITMTDHTTGNTISSEVVTSMSHALAWCYDHFRLANVPTVTREAAIVSYAGFVRVGESKFDVSIRATYEGNEQSYSGTLVASIGV
jgi:hypothetical protein